MKRDINYSDIKSFIVLVEEGSFTKAAAKLLCSRSQVSKQLSQLEANLGVSLLVRTTRTQHLTPSGELFYEKCKRSFNGIEHAIDRAMESATELSGEIKINCVGGYIGENIVGPLVADFMKENPEMNVLLDFSSRRVDLVSGEFDFVFRMGELADSALIARKLTELSIGIYASPEYVKQYGQPSEPKDLVEHKCIVGSMNTWTLKNSESQVIQEVTVKGDLVCKNGRIMLYSALRGNGIIRVPEIYCRKERDEGSLVPVFEYWQPKSTPLSLVYLQDKHQPMRIKVFRDFVLKNFVNYLRTY
ncbi:MULTISPECIES: LysR family transcriptional regulator [Pseudoalteromonas]|uniref:LysR family transcriptional regulator n=1 Tax=Pseudoalteromonas TaxID=53246 RepID=UPI000FFEF18E|nr:MULTISPECIES: LysR family transcriptional regulator [Pseudoalteromonas]NKC19480.1 LysR family transcriptional regulator [Pseudoalteromonas galatheae]RXE88615.1 LysR family transcriptional regulator [Pseudoalteromonas sp. A757]